MNKSDDGLEAGIMAVIVLVSLLVVALIALFIIQKRRVGGGANVDQNAAKDHSQALNLEVDGEVLKEAVESLKTTNMDQFDFEAVDVPMDSPDGQKMAQYADKNGKSNGVGHGRMV
jgi:flagellar biosynthesis/type III secretory pathway M-ring protein FliF/YscJ